MLTLYYAPGACSMASHIALEETGAAYEARSIAFAQSEQRSPAYLKINPRGRVPALDIDGQVLTENLAILTYLAKRFSAANLWPSDPMAAARCLSTMAFFASSVHAAFAHVARPERYAADPAAHATLKEVGLKAFFDYCREIDGLLAGKDWLIGQQYTVCDPYAFVFYCWAVRAQLPAQELKAFTAHKNRMLQRPAVRRVVEQENIPIT